jgi:cell division protein FtsB
VSDDAELRKQRDEALRAEIEDLRSGKEDSEPESPREFTDRKARESREKD